MTKLTAVVFSLLATGAYAFQGRPVSDLRFEGRAGQPIHRIATDGIDTLVLSGKNQYRSPALFTQKIAEGTTPQPQRQIANGEPLALAWTGSSYFAAWRRDNAVWAAALSRDGSILSTPVLHQARDVAADRHGALAFRYLGSTVNVQPLDATGNVAGGERSYSVPWSILYESTVGPAAGGYGLVLQSSYDAMALMTFRSDGSAITPAPVPLESVGATSELPRVVATNGIDTLVVYSVRKSGVMELRSAVVSASGVVKSTRVIETLAVTDSSQMLRVTGAVWTGSQYAVAFVKELSYGSKSIALVRISASGERIGERVQLAGSTVQNATALGWNRDELLLSRLGSTAVSLEVSALTPRSELPLGRTLTTQAQLALAPVPGGSLAAWNEITADRLQLRVSRLDAAGNYLDGEGIVVHDRGHYAGSSPIALETTGPRWLLVWSNGDVNGLFLTPRGTPEGEPFRIGEGLEAAVRWDGTQYVVVSQDDDGIYTTTVSASGVVGETRLVDATSETWEGIYKESVFIMRPLVTMAGNRPLGIYGHYVTRCEIINSECDAEGMVKGVYLDTPGAVPFPIAPTVSENSSLAVAASPTQILVLSRTWEHGLRGTLLSAAAPEQGGVSFEVASGWTKNAAVAFDGHDFVAAWRNGGLSTARISKAGAVSDVRSIPLPDGDHVVITADATHPPLAGLTAPLASYDSVERAFVMRPSEMVPASAPVAPTILCATRIEDGQVRVNWEPVENSLGVAIELELPDGLFRTIGVAPAGASPALVSLADLEGSAIRVRAWNNFGVSLPSAIAPSLPAPDAVVRANPFACAGVPVEVTASLRGTAPFIVQWSDGFMQNVAEGSTAKRWVTLDRDTTLSVVTVSDASCEVGTMNGGVDIQVGALPHITQQTTALRVKAQQTATLNVTTAAAGTQFAWYEGVRGDTTHPVGRNQATLTTPPVTRSTQYWARLTTTCGTVDSQTMTVTVDGRRRAAGK